MHITLDKSVKKYLNENKDNFTNPLYYFNDTYLPESDIEVMVSFDEKHRENDDSLGECITFSKEGFKPHKYIIFVDTRQSFEQILVTLFHEMTHIKQHHTLKIKYDSFGNIIWKNKIYLTSKEDYSNWPWELEADKNSYEMLKKWKSVENQVKYKNKTNKIKEFINAIFSTAGQRIKSS